MQVTGQKDSRGSIALLAESSAFSMPPPACRKLGAYPGTGWKLSRAIAPGSTVFELTISGGSASYGRTRTLRMLKLSTITEVNHVE